MVEMRYGGAGEWTREGKQKSDGEGEHTPRHRGAYTGAAAKYVRRRGLFVKKGQRMNVRGERARFASSRVAPQEL